jgi:hypothetical protein
VKQAVGQKPVILGKRLRTRYFQTESYFEVDIDISANRTAAHATSLVAGAICTLVFDIAIVLEVCFLQCPLANHPNDSSLALLEDEAANY